MASKKKRDSIIRVGDSVVVKVPRFVVRVGYPKTVDDYLVEVREKHTEAVDKLFQEVVGDTNRYSYRTVEALERTKQRERVERELAYLLACGDGFGGTERSIHWVEKPEFDGVEMEVVGVRTAYTGVYESGYSRGRHPSDVSCEYEPPCLGDLKAHRIARVRTTRPVARMDSVFTGFLQEGTTSKGKLGLEIPVYHLEKLQPGEARAE